MIEPIRKRYVVDCAPEVAFDVFVNRIAAWWPGGTHSLSAQVQGTEPADIRFEPRVGGRIYEIDPQGAEHLWGTVAAFQPGSRVVFFWHVGRPESQATEVEVGFASLDDGRTEVRLEHRNWEALGEEGDAMRKNYDSGWDFVVGEHFARGLL